MTTLDFKINKTQINNFDSLPEQVKSEINNIDRLESVGFQEVIGYNGRQAILSLGGYWDQDEDFFIAQNYGSKELQWNGPILKTTSKTIEIK